MALVLHGRFIGAVGLAVAPQVVAVEAETCLAYGTRRGVPPTDLRFVVARVGLQDVVFEPLVRRG